MSVSVVTTGGYELNVDMEFDKFRTLMNTVQSINTSTTEGESVGIRTASVALYFENNEDVTYFENRNGG